MLLPSSLSIVSAGFGPISTRRVLADNHLKKTINACGQALTQTFLRDASHSNFMALSRIFSICVGLVSSRLRRVMSALDLSGFTCSMMMLGVSLFCIVRSVEVTNVEGYIRYIHLHGTTLT